LYLIPKLFLLFLSPLFSLPATTKHQHYSPLGRNHITIKEINNPDYIYKFPPPKEIKSKAMASELPIENTVKENGTNGHSNGTNGESVANGKSSFAVKAGLARMLKGTILCLYL